MSSVADILSAPIALSGVPKLVRKCRARSALTVLVYHDPSPEVFDAHIGWLRQRYKIVSINDAVSALMEGKISELGSYPLVVTIDDGHIGNANLLPVIRKHRIRPCIYLCSALVGTRRPISDYLVSRRYPQKREAYKQQNEAGRRRMFRELFGMELEDELAHPMTLTREQIDRMAKYVDFGSHGRFHQSIPFLSDSDLDRELRLSRSEVQALIGQECRHFSFPTGLHDPRSIRAVADAGYVSARTTDAGWNSAKEDIYCLKVTGASDDASLAKLSVQSAGIFRFVRQWLQR